MRESPDIGLLHHVLGLAVAAENAASEPIKPAVVGLHDRAQRRLVTGPRTVDQLGFGCPGFGGYAGRGPSQGGHALVSIRHEHWMHAREIGSRQSWFSLEGKWSPLVSLDRKRGVPRPFTH